MLPPLAVSAYVSEHDNPDDPTPGIPDNTNDSTTRQEHQRGSRRHVIQHRRQGLCCRPGQEEDHSHEALLPGLGRQELRLLRPQGNHRVRHLDVLLEWHASPEGRLLNLSTIFVVDVKVVLYL